MKKRLITALTLMAVSGFAWAAGGSGKMSFQELDANSDGKISKSEAASSSKVDQKFTQADANSDGNLDQAEFAAVETESSGSGSSGSMDSSGTGNSSSGGTSGSGSTSGGSPGSGSGSMSNGSTTR